MVWELEGKNPTTEASGEQKEQDLEYVICEGKENPKELVLVNLKRRSLKGVKCCYKEDR